ncbi:DUF6993 domain-containing protein [Microbacterium sp. YY-01]|uniref:DUF6993 domain-containing protein n=1 Tax=Microbacterium sp. YY-01 TaxID=3421634 RepID=UPI003D1828CE
MLTTETRLAPKVRATLLSLSGIIVAAALTGCSILGWDGAESTPTPTAAPTSATDDDATPDAGPTLHPDGTAEDNLPLFTQVVEKVWASEDQARNLAYVDALVEAGFDRSHMEMTHDISTVQYPAESFQVAVRWSDGQCLMGQMGPSTGDPVTAVMPQMAEGNCLIGETPPVGE